MIATIAAAVFYLSGAYCTLMASRLDKPSDRFWLVAGWPVAMPILAFLER